MKGLLLAYTGNGKGKTTAALGLSLRALGHDQKVGFLQFMKGSKNYGEVKISEKLPNLTLVQTGRDCFVSYENPDPVDIAMAHEGLEILSQWFKEDRFDLIVADELLVALDFKLVTVQEVMELLEKRPPRLHLVLTGRYAPDEILAIADTVTVMQEHRHAYQQGVEAKEGMEF
ncbi:ATP:corrinoid adenosyltransferase [Desulfitobacterium dehalogenans ATCC 51507]|uniref:ATP:corrinoid adenosyltransferase n=1 Tax=Desulfitobacterium dehalogenans (strain ATCC 51507 / DSM 9161 / JW/IU-DC1) TaxID=756499 RepID=I4AD48_DESDJ|nr:cob(I)yrinic acid a,c-diamide adenosyltransferase [Desulfitobacterium dehalogenans]AFM01883.1 ATP:corrinoid adenosyltransferase [Desulfitobacterium dehalogenans ATCC 51507]